MSERYSLQDLLDRTHGAPEAQLILRLTLSPDISYDEFADAVEEAIDLIVDRICQNPQLRQGRGEDELSIELVDNLRSMSFEATHESAAGGHCDIVVFGRRKFIWLGEAKIHKSYEWLWKGFQQLATRYSAGLDTGRRGGMIIYSYRPRVDRMISKWRKKLKEKVSEVKILSCDRSAAFISEHQHQNTGTAYRVRHVAACLHFNPRDRGL